MSGPPHIIRMKEEAEELETKLIKGKEFANSGRLKGEDASLLYIQLAAMETYLEILKLRLDRAVSV